MRKNQFLFWVSLVQLFSFTLCDLTFASFEKDTNGLLSIDYAFTFWDPTGIEGVDYQTEGLNALQLALDLNPLGEKIARQLGFPFPLFGLRVEYLFTPGNRAEQKELLKSTVFHDDNTGIERLFANLALLKWRTDTDENLGLDINVTYDNAAFLSKLTLNEDKIYKDFDGNVFSFHSGEQLIQRTDFEKITIAADIMLNKYFTVGAGAFFQEYRKPYSPIIGGEQVSDVITDTKFSSELQSMTYLAVHTLKDNEDFFIQLKFGVCWGEADIEFTKNTNMAETYLDKYETVELNNIEFALGGYLRLKEDLPLFLKDLNISFSAGWEYYDYSKARITEDGIESDRESEDLDMNYDQLYYFHTGIILTF